MNSRSVRKLRAALTLILGAGATLTVMSPASAQTPAPSDTPPPTQPASSSTSSGETKDETMNLEKFEVTGSRVKRTDYETPQPLVVFSTQNIQDTGYRTIGEFVQTLPFNSGSANSVFQGNSFTRGAVTANPRGLGSNRFLTLINGRRAATYALTNSFNQSIFDFNSIPLAAVDSIEYVKDGASAIYGSDAITGVMNIKLKKNYLGLRTEVMVGNTFGHDSMIKEGSILAGAQTGKTSLMFVFNYQGANSSFIKDYDRSKSTNYAGDGPKGINQNSTANYPANVNLTAAQAVAAGFSTGSGSYVLVGGVPTANPTLSQFTRAATIPNENRYDFAQVYQLQPDYDNYSFYTHVNHDFSDKLTAFAEFMYSDNNTKYSFTPSVIQSTQNPGTGPTGLLNVPANNPYNPFGIDLTNFLYRTNFGPPRKYDTDSVGANVLVGLKGQINSDWSWELGSAYGYGTVTTVARNQIRATDLQAALNGTTRATALNPFGPSDNQTLVNNLFTISNSSAKVTSYGTDLTVGGNLSQLPLPGGDIGISVGGEIHHDKLDTRPDTASYVGSGGGLPLTGTRSIKSLYAEISVPFFKSKTIGSLEAQVAGRHEDYNDFGKANKPKFGGKYHVPENNFVDLVFRGSFSEAFKAPDLGRLYASQTVGFSSTVLQDPLRPQDPATQLRIVTGGNPKLQPENARIQYLGVIIEPPKSVKNPWLRDLSFSVDYFKFRIDNVINTPSAQFIVSTAGLAQLPSAIVRDNSTENPGPILYLAGIPVNLAQQSYTGYDFELNYKVTDQPFGRFEAQIKATYIADIASNSGLGAGNIHNAGLYNNPRLNMTGNFRWTYKHWGTAVFITRTGSYFNDGYTAAGWGENASTQVSPSVDYNGLWNIIIKVGLDNAFNQEPPRNGYDPLHYDPNTYGGTLVGGRFAYVRVSKEF